MLVDTALSFGASASGKGVEKHLTVALALGLSARGPRMPTRHPVIFYAKDDKRDSVIVQLSRLFRAISGRKP